MKVLAVITARGGSKGIPRKNLVELHGKPLLKFTTEVALASKAFDRIILSTEDDEIAEAGKLFGVDVPFMRPAKLAQDDTPSIPVVQHAVDWAENDIGQNYDAVFLLQPTNPLRTVGDIETAIELLKTTDVDSVISYVDVGEKHPARMKQLSDSHMVIDPPFAEQYEGQRRQELPPLYLRDGSVYLTRRSVLMEQNSLKGERCRAMLMPMQRACAIDTPFDLFLAEQLLKYGEEGSFSEPIVQ